MSEEPRLRYPGINAFTKDDHEFFWGRKTDAKHLLDSVMIKNMVVLHGESGSGKTSIVQAGLLHLLKAHNKFLREREKAIYLPVIIRFDSILRVTKAGRKEEGMAGDSLIQQTLKAIYQAGGRPERLLPFLDARRDNLWYTVKQFQRDGVHLLLIFDQFEMLQSYSYPQITYFAKELADLFASPMPDELYSEYDRRSAAIASSGKQTPEEVEQYKRDISSFEQPLAIRMMFVVREDKLGTMSLLSDHFPEILMNELRLQQLDEDAARKAIEKPASMKGVFVHPDFALTADAVDHLMFVLKDKNTGRYDPIELQIVCSSLEKGVAKEGGLKKEDIPDIGNIISTFYGEAWKMVRARSGMNAVVFDQWKRRIIEQLVVDGRRNMVIENLLVEEEDSMGKGLLKELVDGGLLREMPAGKDLFFQLRHDRLIAPMMADLRDLKAGEIVRKETRSQKMKSWRLAAFLLASVAVVAMYYFFNSKSAERQAREDRYQLISVSLKRAGNPTLAYLVGRDFLQKNPTSDTMAQYLRSFDPADAAYLTGVYPALARVDRVYKKKGQSGYPRGALSNRMGCEGWNASGANQFRT